MNVSEALDLADRVRDVTEQAPFVDSILQALVCLADERDALRQALESCWHMGQTEGPIRKAVEKAGFNGSVWLDQGGKP